MAPCCRPCHIGPDPTALFVRRRVAAQDKTSLSLARCQLLKAKDFPLYCSLRSFRWFADQPTGNQQLKRIVTGGNEHVDPKTTKGLIGEPKKNCCIRPVVRAAWSSVQLFSHGGGVSRRPLTEIPSAGLIFGSLSS